VASIPKTEVLFVSCDELVARVVSGAALLAQFVGAEAVEGGRVRVGGRVVVDGVGGDFEGDASGDVLAVGEGEAFEDFAVEGRCVRR
jgi:hypothetical protein